MRKIIFALLPLLVGCTNFQNKEKDSANPDNQDGLVTFHLNAPPSKVKPLMLSEIADSVSYVALETTKETITKYGLRYGDRFYTISGDKLLCFDKNGVYLHQVGCPGRGPGEYIWYDFNRFSDFSYFTVDITTNWVYFFSDDRRTLVYDELGHFVKSLDGEFSKNYPVLVFNHMAYFDLHGINIVDERTNQIERTDSILINKRKKSRVELREKFKKEGESMFIYPGMLPISFRTDDTYYCWSIFDSDTVFMAKDKEVRPLCLIIPENKYKPENQFVDGVNSKINQPLILRMYVLKNQILLCVQYFYSHEEKMYFWVLCDLKSGSVTFYSKDIVNDLDGGPNILIPNMLYDEEIYSLSVEDLKNDEEIYNSYFTKGVKAKLKDQDGKFQRLLEPLAEDANPIIRTIHWKK